LYGVITNSVRSNRTGANYCRDTGGLESLLCVPDVMIDRFLIQKGTLGNMISMFLGNERLVDKVQPELLKFLRDQGTYQLLLTLLENELVKWKGKQLKDFENYINQEEVVSFVVHTVHKHVPFFEWIDQPMEEWSGAYSDFVMNNLIPRGVELALTVLSSHLQYFSQSRTKRNFLFPGENCRSGY